MKSNIIKHIALIVLLLAGGLSISAQNDRTSTAFAIDKNIISFEVANLVEKYICEYPPQPGWGSPEGFSPHIYTINLIMDEGTDITSLTPIITLAPGATIKSIETSAPGASISSGHKGAWDFSHQVDYIVIAEDGSIVIYKFLAKAGKTRGNTVWIRYQPSDGSWGTTYPSAGTVNNASSIYVTAYPQTSYEFDRWQVTEMIYSGYNPYSTSYGRTFSKTINYDTDILAVFQAVIQTYSVSLVSENTNKGTVSNGGSCSPGGSLFVKKLKNREV